MVPYTNQFYHTIMNLIFVHGILHLALNNLQSDAINYTIYTYFIDKLINPLVLALHLRLIESI